MSTVRRDQLLELQERVQEKWNRLQITSIDIPKETKEYERETANKERSKFLVTFPYPYMNGFLHLGHAFSLSKAEFAARYQHLCGKRSLFPFAFHCTGMPIQACADRLRKEIEAFGCPPLFPEDLQEQCEVATNASEQPQQQYSQLIRLILPSSPPWKILESLGVPCDLVPKFADPLYWLQYFPPYGIRDLKRLGVFVDWRRSFITTEANPFYDSFVRWQFWTLKERGKIKFGKRYTVYSPLDRQACADHDRASGEGAGPLEYIGVKLQLEEETVESHAVLKSLKRKPIFLIAATLRPETIYGVTNCWIASNGTYGVYEIIYQSDEWKDKPESEYFIMTPRAARNMAFQGFDGGEFGKPKEILQLTGEQLIGLSLKSPECSFEKIYILPMFNVSTQKGTGIVMSVPSDSPDDYRALLDLKEKAGLREKFHLKNEWVFPFEPVPVVDVPTFGDLSAKVACEKFHVRSQNDVDALKKAKDLVYLKGFYEGKLLKGPYAGELVQEAKAKIKGDLVSQKKAIVYCEPEFPVISRSGDECVVALVDQWYLDYGEPNWRELAKKCLSRMNTFGTETQRSFEFTFDWLHEWACSRSFGLGTKLPWDPQYVIESLSDSTIYMAYYTVAHLIQGEDNLDGKKPNPIGIKAEQMTPAVWNFIFLGENLSEEQWNECSIPKWKLELLRKEFCYWYPMDLRVSGKDLIGNHLTFCIYNHVALFNQENWPRAFRANGHMMINSEKMSKSTGNFLTLQEAIDKYSSDAVRFALADAGDGVEDANFQLKTADDAVLKLTALLAFVKEGCEQLEIMRTEAAETSSRFEDRVFLSEIRRTIRLCKEKYDEMLYREALKIGFFEFQEALGRYRKVVHADKSKSTMNDVNRELFLFYCQIQALVLCPVCPHTSEMIWEWIAKATQQNAEASILQSHWPTVEFEDESILAASRYLEDTLHRMRLQMMPKKSKKSNQQLKSPKSATIVVCVEPPYWQRKSVDLLRSVFNASSNEFEADIPKLISSCEDLKDNIKKVMSFVGMIRDKTKEQGAPALDLKLLFDEVDVLLQNRTYVMEELSLKSLLVIKSCDVVEETRKELISAARESLPTKPTFVFEYEEN
ncbi:leucyl-tRNA synthetase [Galdieria sulphuraria]|uniref:leucine--tRNA ligase n=1 Tax=Galdieria sulphuraria TaxID=130081 RepID=M2Y9W2_GALSU|nr:leucyl-tRNA synthetase [Galdieria sulphuraria]EME32838.1 leucyl-tRNA synthetase [Galdieria sulphuraria]|eukprot:XP_005709358.1 leucyl-tRNA synthetase [Galdieria sulphuraria]